MGSKGGSGGPGGQNRHLPRIRLRGSTCFLRVCRRLLRCGCGRNHTRRRLEVSPARFSGPLVAPGFIRGCRPSNNSKRVLACFLNGPTRPHHRLPAGESTLKRALNSCRSVPTRMNLGARKSAPLPFPKVCSRTMALAPNRGGNLRPSPVDPRDPPFMIARLHPPAPSCARLDPAPKDIPCLRLVAFSYPY